MYVIHKYIAIASYVYCILAGAARAAPALELAMVGTTIGHAAASELGKLLSIIGIKARQQYTVYVPCA